MGRRRNTKGVRREKRSKRPTYETLLRQAGLFGNRIGRAAEMRVHKSFRAPDIPEWFLGIHKKDSAGVDFYVLTSDIGEIPLQIKSSEIGKESFLNNPDYTDIPVVVIDLSESDQEVRKKVVGVLNAYRERHFQTKEKKRNYLLFKN